MSRFILPLTTTCYTKHYFMGTERIATAIGGGGFCNMVYPVDVLDTREKNLQTDIISYLSTYLTAQYDIQTSNEDINRNAYPELQYVHDRIPLYDVNVSIKPEVDLCKVIENLCYQEVDDEPYYYHPDHLGGAAWITDKSGFPVQYLHYAPYGEMVANQQTTGYDERFKFTGKERDAETGFDYFGARYYIPDYSIFSTVDPLTDKNIESSSYMYCDGNPIKYVDPDGREKYIFIMMIMGKKSYLARACMIACVIMMHIEPVIAGRNTCGSCDFYDDHRELFCENVFDLINATGDINTSIIYYDLGDFSYAGLEDRILLHDIFNFSIGESTYRYISCFYQINGKKPNSFTKSLMKDFLLESASDINPIRFYEVAGWELLKGDILPRDTTLGKRYLSVASGVPEEQIDSHILPFWRDTMLWNIYKQKHDSLLMEWGHKFNYQLATKVIENGDTIAYKQLIEGDRYHKFMIYSIYMIDQYNYIPAYEDLFRCLKSLYKFHNQTFGPYALQWLFKIMITHITDIPEQLFTDVEDEIKGIMNKI